MNDVRDIASVEPIESELIRHAFGEILARRRDEAGFKQRMFSRVVGISNSHLRGIEQGSVSPTLVTICKLAATLEVDPSEMVAEAYQMARQLQQDPKVSVRYRSTEH